MGHAPGRQGLHHQAGGRKRAHGKAQRRPGPAMKDPIALLEDIERRSLERARGLPLQVEVKPTWTGIGFRMGDSLLAAPLAEIREILTYPGLTRIPGARPWIKGIANVRGNLLPVMDLQAHLKGKETPLSSKCKVLVTGHGEVVAGFLVGEVLG
ncbi:MAG: purine-binding chemotaxis protein CheW, partial [Gammaproteobacteria bacterium]